MTPIYIPDVAAIGKKVRLQLFERTNDHGGIRTSPQSEYVGKLVSYSADSTRFSFKIKGLPIRQATNDLYYVIMEVIE